MAVMIKSRREIAQLRQAGQIVAETYEKLRPFVQPGISTAELDRLAEAYIRSRGALPAYKGYGGKPAVAGRAAIPPFPATICVAINEEICHGIPSPGRILQEGDIIGIDVGVSYNGWMGDSCVTFPVGSIDQESRRLIATAHACLQLGIAQAQAGKHLGDIGYAVQTCAQAQGFSTVYELCAHGVGRSIHEDPSYPHVGRPGSGLRLRPGMVLTIEPMVTAGQPEIRLLADRWTICSADGSRCAQFEHTLAVTENGPEILTTL